MTEPPADPFLSDSPFGQALRDGGVIVAGLIDAVWRRDVGGLRQAVDVLDRSDLEAAAVAQATQVGLAHLVLEAEPHDADEGGGSPAGREDGKGVALLAALASLAAAGDVEGLVEVVEESSDERLRAVLYDPIAAALERVLDRYREPGS